jgi:hypothetical protein
MGIGQNCLKTQPISHYHGNMTSESMVAHSTLARAELG